MKNTMRDLKTQLHLATTAILMGQLGGIWIIPSIAFFMASIYYYMKSEND